MTVTVTKRTMTSDIQSDGAGHKIDLTSPAYLARAMRRLRERTKASA